MIKSIQFTGQGKDDYIIKRNEVEVVREGISQDYADEVKKFYRKRDSEYKKCWMTVKGDYSNPQLVTNLLNRKFVFSPDRINVLFGPNASGKTTIIRAIAANCMCGSPQAEDGFTSFLKFSPHNLDMISLREDYDDWDSTRKKQEYINAVRHRIVRISGNEAIVEWDGSPTYYENTASRRMISFGDAIGGLIQNEGEELHYLFGKDKSSSGQMTIWMFNKLRQIVSLPPSIEQLIEQNKKASHNVNETWEFAYKSNIDYYDSVIENAPSKENQITTILLDEMDKSLGITNVITLYRDAFPNLLHSSKCQLIVVSHSPVILSDEIYKSDEYNIISLDEDYTQKCREELSKLNFRL